MTDPTVTIVIPVLNEAAHIERCLDAVAGQTYPHIVETLVVDGGSVDRTRELAASRPGVSILDNPQRLQAPALNIGLRAAAGEVIVRLDGHCVPAPDYVKRCVAALARSSAAMVGGAMRPVAEGSLQRAVATAMTSRIGAGPARFHVGGESGWVDTVYLGAYRTELGRAVGGYAEDVGVNEDAEFAIRMRPRGGIWYDDSIRSTYTPRATIGAVARQFYRYGRSRAATVRRHPASLSPRQLAAPALVLSLLTPWRARVLTLYLALVVGRSALEYRDDPEAAPFLVAVLPAMHISWGAGFWAGLLGARPPAPAQPAPDAHAS